MRRLWLAPITVGAVAFAGCAKPQHLPGRAHWYGSAIWVPTGDAAALAGAICKSETLETYGGGEGAGEVRPVVRWRAGRLAEGGELLTCLSGVQKQFTR